MTKVCDQSLELLKAYGIAVITSSPQVSHPVVLPDSSGSCHFHDNRIVCGVNVAITGIYVMTAVVLLFLAMLSWHLRLLLMVQLIGLVRLMNASNCIPTPCTEFVLQPVEGALDSPDPLPSSLPLPLPPRPQLRHREGLGTRLVQGKVLYFARASETLGEPIL